MRRMLELLDAILLAIYDAIVALENDDERLVRERGPP